MNIAKLLPISLMTLIFASSAYANTAQLRVTGSIIPGSCEPSFSGDGVVDHGNLAITTLNVAAVTVLPVAKFDFNVVCDAPIRIGMTWQDNRAGTASTTNVKNFGLGKQGTQNLGFYTLTTRTGTLDGTAGAVIASANNGNFAAGGANNNDGSTRISFAAARSTTPLPASVFTGSMDVTTTVVRTDSLDLTEKVVLDGSATLELKYF